MRRLGAWLRAETPLSLPAFLGVALLLRLPAVAWARGYEFLDQQFQYVDPAWHLATGAAWHRTWEWIDGVRSLVHPGALAGVFVLGRSLGIAAPEPLLGFARLAHALLGLVPMAALWLVVTRWRPVAGQRQVLLWVASWFLVVYAAVQPNAPFAAASLSVASVLFFLGPGRLWPFVAGLCLGLAFCGRAQDAVFGPVLVVAGALQRRWAASALLVLGCVPGVLGQGLLDLEVHGRFLHTAWRYVELNLVYGAASRWPAAAPLAYAGIVAGLFLMVFPSAWRWFARGARALPLPLAVAVAYLLIHSLIARKQFRFVVPALVLLGIVHAAGMVGEAYARRAAGARDDRLTKVHRRVWLGAQGILLVLAWFAYFHRGPVEAAQALAARGDFTGALAVVDGSETSVGGWYYLQRQDVQVECVARERLAGWLADPARPARVHLMVVGVPLAGAAPEGWRLTEWFRSADLPDWKARNRRFLYVAERR
ncbi:MAG: hypothetical protein IT458_16785 [Planctomycetes bacterium]|nr:hypothetical protein [Planctomycetota bacterium]